MLSILVSGKVIIIHFWSPHLRWNCLEFVSIFRYLKRQGAQFFVWGDWVATKIFRFFPNLPWILFEHLVFIGSSSLDRCFFSFRNVRVLNHDTPFTDVASDTTMGIMKLINPQGSVTCSQWITWILSWIYIHAESGKLSLRIRWYVLRIRDYPDPF